MGTKRKRVRGAHFSAYDLVLRSRHLARNLAWVLKKGCVHTSFRGVLLKGTKSGRSLRIRNHELKRPKQLQ